MFHGIRKLRSDILPVTFHIPFQFPSVENVLINQIFTRLNRNHYSAAFSTTYEPWIRFEMINKIVFHFNFLRNCMEKEMVNAIITCHVNTACRKSIFKIQKSKTSSVRYLRAGDQKDRRDRLITQKWKKAAVLGNLKTGLPASDFVEKGGRFTWQHLFVLRVAHLQRRSFPTPKRRNFALRLLTQHFFQFISVRELYTTYLAFPTYFLFYSYFN